jgi:hypothetical protein
MGEVGINLPFPTFPIPLSVAGKRSFTIRQGIKSPVFLPEKIVIPGFAPLYLQQKR